MIHQMDRTIATSAYHVVPAPNLTEFHLGMKATSWAGDLYPPPIQLNRADA